MELNTIYNHTQIEEFATDNGYSITHQGKKYVTGEHLIVLTKDDHKISLLDVGMFPYQTGYKVTFKK